MGKLNRPYTLTDLNQHTPNLSMPTNSLEQRQSAHFQEINYRYSLLMKREFIKQYEKIAEARKQLNTKERLTKYADPSYEYVEMGSNL